MQDKRKELITYISSNVGPILTDLIKSDDITKKVVISSDVDKKELCGYYIEDKYTSPFWYNDLINNNIKILIIDNIDNISKEEQSKFIELLKYRKISTFDIPKDVVIIVIAKDINKDRINEDLYSLVIHI